MAATDKLMLKVDPESVLKGGTSKLTATLTNANDKPLGAGINITFTSTLADKSELGIGAAPVPTDAKGEARIDFPNITDPTSADADSIIVKAFVVPAAGAAVETTSDELKIGIFETDEEVKLDIKLRELSKAKKEKQDQDRIAEQKAKAVQRLEQEIVSKIKTPDLPKVIASTKTAYEKVVDGFKKDNTDAEGKLTEIGTLISAQINKAKLEDLVAQRAQIDGAIQELEARLSKLDATKQTLEDTVNNEKDKRDSKKAAWEDAKRTQTTIKQQSANLKAVIAKMDTDVKNAVAGNDKTLLANVYLELLKAKEQLTALNKMVIEPSVLEKNLGSTWQQLVAQSQQVAITEDQLQQNKSEKIQVTEDRDQLKASRNNKIDEIIKSIVK